MGAVGEAGGVQRERVSLRAGGRVPTIDQNAEPVGRPGRADPNQTACRRRGADRVLGQPIDPDVHSGRRADHEPAGDQNHHGEHRGETPSR